MDALITVKRFEQKLDVLVANSTATRAAVEKLLAGLEHIVSLSVQGPGANLGAQAGAALQDKIAEFLRGLRA